MTIFQLWESITTLFHCNKTILLIEKDWELLEDIIQSQTQWDKELTTKCLELSITLTVFLNKMEANINLMKKSLVIKRVTKWMSRLKTIIWKQACPEDYSIKLSILKLIKWLVHLEKDLVSILKQQELTSLTQLEQVSWFSLILYLEWFFKNSVTSHQITNKFTQTSNFVYTLLSKTELIPCAYHLWKVFKESVWWMENLIDSSWLLDLVITERKDGIRNTSSSKWCTTPRQMLEKTSKKFGCVVHL